MSTPPFGKEHLLTTILSVFYISNINTKNRYIVRSKWTKQSWCGYGLRLVVHGYADIA